MNPDRTKEYARELVDYFTGGTTPVNIYKSGPMYQNISPNGLYSLSDIKIEGYKIIEMYNYCKENNPELFI